VVAALRRSGQRRSYGFLAAGLNPWLEFDHRYRGFVDFETGQSVPRVRIHPAPPSSPGLRGFSSTFSEIAPTARVPRDLKDSGELAVEVS
jgi:hypothetical protein